jgi:hypothetical protein
VPIVVVVVVVLAPDAAGTGIIGAVVGAAAGALLAGAVLAVVAGPLGQVLVTVDVVGSGVGVASVLAGVPTKIGKVTAVSWPVTDEMA